MPSEDTLKQRLSQYLSLLTALAIRTFCCLLLTHIHAVLYSGTISLPLRVDDFSAALFAPGPNQANINWTPHASHQYAWHKWVRDIRKRKKKDTKNPRQYFTTVRSTLPFPASIAEMNAAIALPTVLLALFTPKRAVPRLLRERELRPDVWWYVAVAAAGTLSYALFLVHDVNVFVFVTVPWAKLVADVVGLVLKLGGWERCVVPVGEGKERAAGEGLKGDSSGK